MNSDVFLFLFIGLFFAYLGYLIKFKKKVSLITGIDISKVKDINGLADWLGSSMFFLSWFTLLLAVLQFLYPNLTASLLTVFGMVITAGAVLIIALGQKYECGFETEELQSFDVLQLERAGMLFNSPVPPLDANQRTPLERVLYQNSE